MGAATKRTRKDRDGARSHSALKANEQARTNLIAAQKRVQKAENELGKTRLAKAVSEGEALNAITAAHADGELEGTDVIKACTALWELEGKRIPREEMLTLYEQLREGTLVLFVDRDGEWRGEKLADNAEALPNPRCKSGHGMGPTIKLTATPLPGEKARHSYESLVPLMGMTDCILADEAIQEFVNRVRYGTDTEGKDLMQLRELLAALGRINESGGEIDTTRVEHAIEYGTEQLRRISHRRRSSFA